MKHCATFSILYGLGLFSVAIAQQPPELQSPQWNFGANVQATNYLGGLTKPSGGTAWNGGASSAQMILRNGRVEFQAVPGSQAAVGLSSASGDDTLAEIDYAIYVIPSGTSTTTGTAKVYQNGTEMTALALGSFTVVATFTVERIGNQIRYSKTDADPAYPDDPDRRLVTTKTSSVLSYGPLLVDTSFYKQGSLLNWVQIATGDLDNDGMPDEWEAAFLPANHGWAERQNFQPQADNDTDGVTNLQEFRDGTSPIDPLSFALPIDWQNRVNTTLVTGGAGGLKRGTAAAGWTADADSGAQKIAGDGLVSFTVPLASHLAVGLTPSNDNRSYTDLEYRIHVTSANACSLRAPEQTADLAIGTYTAATVFAVQRTGGIVRFIKDGVVVYTSTTRSSEKLLADCSLYSPNTQINTARIACGDVDEDEIPDAWEIAYLAMQPDYTLEGSLGLLSSFLPEGDADADGLTNLQEYYDDTHPFQPLSYPSAITWKTGVTSPAVMTTSGTDGQVKKTASANLWNADAVAMKDATTPKTLADTAKLAFSVALGSHLALGFATSNTARTPDNLKYQIRVTASNTVFAYEGTVQKAVMGTYTAATRFALRRVGGSIEFMKDGVVYYTADVLATTALIVDSSFYSLNGEVINAHLYTGDLDEDGIPDSWEIQYLTRWLGHSPTYEEVRDVLIAGVTGAAGSGTPGDLDGDGLSNLDEHRFSTDPTQRTSRPMPIVWRNMVNTSLVGTDGGLKKTSGSNGYYDAWGDSTQYLEGDGTLYFTAANAGRLDIGLTPSGNYYANAYLPAYRFALTSSGASVARPESVNNLSVGTYTAATLFAVRRTGTVIDFLMNGVVVTTSTTPSTETLYAEAVLYTSNHQLASVRIDDPDSNKDGIPDSWELDQRWLSLGKPNFFNATAAQLAALYQDSDLDNDGVSLSNEYLNGTSDGLSDSDGDGMPDYWELNYGLAANDPSNALSDSDSDGFTTLQEYQWSLPPRSLNLLPDRNDDVDDDSLPDPWELQYFGDLRAQTGTGDPDHDGVTNLAEFLAFTNPTRHPGDLDQDGLPDSLELAIFGNLAQTGADDPDHDGLSNFVELFLTSTSALLADTNGDGYLDGYLGSYAATDSDGDGLTNAQEAAMGTNPFKADTDSDGTLDGLDAYALNAMLQTAPQANPQDTTAPVITLAEPLNAQLLP